VADRPVPAVSARTAPYWTGGSSDQLLIARCQACGFWLHPPLPLCTRCRSRDIAPEPVSGRGTVWSYTINRYPWAAQLQPPYVIAEVELDEQPGLRLLTSIVGGDADDPEAVAIGMPVRVRFEQAGEAWIPVFAR
jgi:uncharacterized OB-fold protein